MKDCIGSMGDSNVIAALAVQWGFWQFPLQPVDKDKTIFTTSLEMYHYTRIPFGLRNAPATFRYALDTILSDVRCVGNAGGQNNPRERIVQ